jgi:hypothetical protein
VEDFRLGTMMGMPFGRVIHVLLRNGEVVTLDITASIGPLSSVEGRSRSRCCRDFVSGSLARASPIPFIEVAGYLMGSSKFSLQHLDRWRGRVRLGLNTIGHEVGLESRLPTLKC